MTLSEIDSLKGGDTLSVTDQGGSPEQWLVVVVWGSGFLLIRDGMEYRIPKSFLMLDKWKKGDGL